MFAINIVVGFQFDCVDCYGQTILHISSQKGNFELTKLVTNRMKE